LTRRRGSLIAFVWSQNAGGFDSFVFADAGGKRHVDRCGEFEL